MHARRAKGHGRNGIRHVHAEQGDEAVGVERAQPGEHLVEHHTDGIEIGARIDGLAERLLGRHVVGRAEDHPHLRERLGAARHLRGRAGGGEGVGVQLGDAEVEDLHHLDAVLALHEHDVLGFEVPVHDADVVCARQAGRDLPRDANGPRGLDRRVEQLAEARPGDVLQHEEEGPLRRPPEVGRGHHVRMIDVGRSDGLALEPGDDLRVLGERSVEHLERHALSHVHVLDEVDHAHRALTEGALDPVPLGHDRSGSELQRTWYRGQRIHGLRI